MTQQAAQVAAVAAVVCGCLILGWFIGRRPLRRARREARHLHGLVQEHAGRAQEAEERARVQYVRAEVETAEKSQAELRARVAEDEADHLRKLLELHEATPCVLCGLPLPMCRHGREDRVKWLEEHGGGFPVLPGGSGGPRLPGPGEPGRDRLWRGK